ncbi:MULTISPECIES: hypothetical protein [Enterococcus]|uniref:hypothetical protein n=1 Tax=Enterococcus TaxID=1350 RepID=UPI0011635CF9|nr:hypothetical protein [Enterococcus avium]HAP3021220.1 hypothetical protein [Enterococcus faecalis]AYQ24204.1 hypothetical protein AUF16_06210 [Enterococcus avium]HBI1562050.1 hypothetical protein [Enterococcus faecalis]HBI1565109.1 hypothetical protein [Enterococcus faecalis]HBI1717421.1 hypothetical protein [Enterococcus faecalis]
MYNEGLTYILKVIYQEFELTTELSTNDAQRAIEQLISRMAKNPNPKYSDYNELFPKFPSYFRSVAINSAYDKRSSRCSITLNWGKEQSEAIDNKKKLTKKAPPYNLSTMIYQYSIKEICSIN